jgi:hypothetical protein
VQSYSGKNNTLFDLDEEEKNSSWYKALTKYRTQGMAEDEIDKYRQAYQKKFGLGMVKTLMSKSKAAKAV